ncbi:MAG: flagellar basal body-associated FliL family protein [Alphaproteobacteria bacterium]|nr:flagellar basal body-associated FliL family protein [Alphaproteobacteria bacterium]
MAAQEVDQDIPEEALEEGAEAEDGGTPSRKRLPGKKLVLFGVLPLVFILAGLGGAYFAGLFDPYLSPGETEQAAEAEPEPQHTMIFHDLPDLLVNLNTAGRKSHYLKVSISLELEDAADIPRIQAVMPRIIDNFQIYLRELRVEDLRGSAGLTRLREQLLKRINMAAAPAKILDVLFREMLIQ